MRILLDQNLSPKLIRRLADVLPGLETVYDHGLTGASDPAIFEWARRSRFSAVVSAGPKVYRRTVKRKGTFPWVAVTPPRPRL
ncbi:MAG: DUF5615 family PIN-like protein [Acidobacteria bacterium]|nr:DUF5615 family PIN-like protein [Acidobacteriota bacterium]